MPCHRKWVRPRTLVSASNILHSEPSKNAISFLTSINKIFDLFAIRSVDMIRGTCLTPYLSHLSGVWKTEMVNGSNIVKIMEGLCPLQETVRRKNCSSVTTKATSLPQNMLPDNRTWDKILSTYLSSKEEYIKLGEKRVAIRKAKPCSCAENHLWLSLAGAHHSPETHLLRLGLYALLPKRGGEVLGAWWWNLWFA